MFTDQPATPVRLEMLLELTAHFTNGLKRDAIYDLLQPKPLSSGGQLTAKETLNAALELELVEKTDPLIKLGRSYDKKRSPRENILCATDRLVLSTREVEPYLALFYSYYLGLDKEVYQRKDYSREGWANAFNRDVFGNKTQTNPFNDTKHTGIERWMSYLGLGWHDSDDRFQANPYERIHRTLPIIFGKMVKLDGDIFMSNMAEVCPELDGGRIFAQANKYRSYDPKEKKCSLGVSHALVDLHESRIIKLHCPVDSRGWNIELAIPARDDSIKSDRINIIEYLRK